MDASNTHEHDFTPPYFEAGVYRHYKGGEYKTIGLACHESELTWLVIYQPLYTHEGKPELWARPYDDFMAEIAVNGKRVRRFTKTG